MELYRHEDYEILIPKLFGAEVKKDVAVAATSSTRRKWNETSFFEDAQRKLSPADLEALRRIYALTRERADAVEWGTGNTRGSFNPKFAAVSAKSLFTAYSDGTLVFNIRWLNDLPQSATCREVFKAELAKIPGLLLPHDLEAFHAGTNIDTWRPLIDRILTAVDTVVRAAKDVST